MAEKLYYTMGEVAEMFDVNLSLIRYWDSKFDVLKPKKNKKGNRLFRPEDIENFKMIYHLVKECGMTLEGAQRAMKSRGRNDVSRSAGLMERLQNVRAMLLEMREMMGEDGDDAEYADASDASDASDAVDSVDAAADDTVPHENGVTVLEPGRAQLAEERQSAEKAAQPREANLPFYEQTLF